MRMDIGVFHNQQRNQMNNTSDILKVLQRLEDKNGVEITQTFTFDGVTYSAMPHKQTTPEQDAVREAAKDFARVKQLLSNKNNWFTNAIVRAMLFAFVFGLVAGAIGMWLIK